jgi:redox-sensitive bicupin YhaK (pirin superfamily)
VWDLRLASEDRVELTVPEGHTTALAVLRGTLRVNGSEEVGAAEVGIFDRARTKICIDGARDVKALLLAGEPIDEPIVGQGPFVMNTPQEIRQAIVDYQNGRMGNLG